MEKNFSPFIFDLSLVDQYYSISLTRNSNDNLFSLVIKIPFESSFWIYNFNRSTLLEQSSLWQAFPDDISLIDFIIQSIQLKECEILPNQKDNLDLKLWLFMSLGNMKTKMEFKITLEKKKANQEETIREISIQVQKITKILNKKFFYYKGAFLNNGHNSFAFTNNSRTVQKISGGNFWYGIKSENFGAAGNLVFSIKLNIIDASCTVMLGICTNNTALNQNGFLASNTSFMFYLNGGNFYSRTASTGCASGLTGKNNDIFSVLVDIPRKTMLLFLNGYRCGIPKSIDIKDEEIGLLCPCVDINCQNTMVSFEDFTNFFE